MLCACFSYIYSFCLFSKTILKDHNGVIACFIPLTINHIYVAVSHNQILYDCTWKISFRRLAKGSEISYSGHLLSCNYVSELKTASDLINIVAHRTSNSRRRALSRQGSAGSSTPKRVEHVTCFNVLSIWTKWR